jgi:hypothetical protein
VLSALSDFVSYDASRVLPVASDASQAIEQTSKFLRSHADCSRHAAQALSSTWFFEPNDALRSRQRPPTATSSPQRAQISPQDSGLLARHSTMRLKLFNRRRFLCDPIP